MAVNKGDFVRVNFIGKIKGTDDVFDTTYEEVANEMGIFSENRTYKSIPIVVGSGHLLPALEEAIIGLDEGDSAHVEVGYKDAFGPRDSSLIQLVSAKEFKKQVGRAPLPGMKFQAQGSVGKILTVNGGRVKVDFNNELAGKDLVYDLEVDKIIDGTDEKIKSMIELHYANPNVDIDKTEIDIVDGVLNLKLDELAKFDQKSCFDLSLIKFRIAKDIWDNIEEVDKVNFIETYEEKATSESEEETSVSEQETSEDKAISESEQETSKE